MLRSYDHVSLAFLFSKYSCSIFYKLCTTSSSTLTQADTVENLITQNDTLRVAMTPYMNFVAYIIWTLKVFQNAKSQSCLFPLMKYITLKYMASFDMNYYEV